jgi:hypothetical protein
MFAHSATSNWGAINSALWRSAGASAAPSSSITHLTAMLASITNVFTALHVLAEGELQIASVSGVWSVRRSGQFFKGRLYFIDKGFAENFPLFGLGRAAVACGATLQTS